MSHYEPCPILAEPVEPVVVDRITNAQDTREEKVRALRLQIAQAFAAATELLDLDDQSIADTAQHLLNAHRAARWVK